MCGCGGMVDAADLKSVASNGVRVQVPPRALFCNSLQKQVNKGIGLLLADFIRKLLIYAVCS